MIIPVVLKEDTLFCRRQKLRAGDKDHQLSPMETYMEKLRFAVKG
jgi:hypothetical protein